MSRRRTAWLVATMAGVPLLCWPAIARAGPKLQAVGEATVAVTDNAQSSPDNPVPGVPPKAADAFLILSPGLALSAATRRIVQRLQYTYSLSVFEKQSGANTSSNRLDYLGFFDLSPRTSMLLTSSLVESRPYTTSLVVPPGVGEVAASPPGSSAILGASAGEQLDFDVAEGWRAWQGTGVLAGMPLAGTSRQRTLEATARVGGERAWRADALGLEGRGDYTVITGGVAADGAALGVQKQLVGTGVAVWRHDLGRQFTGRAEAGAVRVQRLSSGRGFWEPTGTASLGWTPMLGNAELSISHRVTTNPLLGQTLLVDEAQLRAGVPFDDKGTVVLGASGGYQRGRLIEEDATLAAHVNTLLLDVGLAWQTTDALGLSLRFQHAEQISDAALPPLPLSYVRNTALLTATVRFPPEREMPRAYRAPQRVDRSDEIRNGVKGSPDQP